MTDFGMIIAVALLAIGVAYFLPKVNCNKNKTNSEEHKLTKLPNVNSEELDHWHRMNRF
jgi:hypothetical protein